MDDVVGGICCSESFDGIMRANVGEGNVLVLCVLALCGVCDTSVREGCCEPFFGERFCGDRFFVEADVDISCEADETSGAVSVCDIPSSSVISCFVVKAYPSPGATVSCFNGASGSGISW